MSDPLLIPLISASDEDSRRQELELLVVEHARPIIEMVLGRFSRSDRAVPRDEIEDILGTVTLRLVRKLQSMAVEADAIRDFENYVATLTYRTIYDYMRERFPERTRLKNRLRYLLTHDARLALWSTPDGLVGGLRAWEGREDALAAADIGRGNATADMFDRERPDRAVRAIFERAGRPLALNALVNVAAELWNVSETQVASHDDVVTEPLPTHAARYETRQFLEALWNELPGLPPNQRAALLLNLRDPSGMNAVALFVLVGVARFDEIAALLGMTRDELSALWESLPLDDLTIASRLRVTRQQVINLRRAARERLARRVLPGKYERRRG